MTMNKKVEMSEKELWLIASLIDNLRFRGVLFEGKDKEFSGDFDRIRDICIANASNYVPEGS